MDGLNLSSNLGRLRRERKITQEELADFIGVTKAAVSKWENRQSTPDIMLLPKLASFFGVTLDELMGYEPQLSSEQIRRYYLELTGDFVKLPVKGAVEKTHSLVRRYYSCYPFLLQVCVLYLNHYMLAEGEENQKKLLQEADALCDRIIGMCTDVGISSEAMTMKAMINLRLGKTKEVIEMLEEVADPIRISRQNDLLLIQAYQVAGEIRKGRSYTQISLYLYLIGMVGAEMSFLSMYAEDLGRCEETIKRTKKLIEAYELKELHPNLSAQFFYQAAVIYATHGKKEEALGELLEFEKCVCSLLDSGQALLHGDAYFDLLEEWIERLPLGEQAPRDMRLARKSALEALSHPSFSELKKTKEFLRIYHHISEKNSHAENRTSDKNLRRKKGSG